jgi:hypothetical protein
VGKGFGAEETRAAFVRVREFGRATDARFANKWLIVSWVDGKAFRLRAERPMMISPREVLPPSEAR